MKTPTTTPPKCSFCGSPQSKVGRLIAGTGGAGEAYICDRCIPIAEELCRSALRPDLADQPVRVRPAQVLAQLDEYVIGQEHAKKALSVALVNHVKRLERPTKIEKSNILLLGPTGSGKTLLAKTLARAAGVPFAITDATTLTAAGYVGEDVESVISKLYAAAGSDVKVTERGIVFVDEVDKTGERRAGNTNRDVGGECVQQGLLKLMEGTVVKFRLGDKTVEVDTSNILFICGGAFASLTNRDPAAVKQRGGAPIGFGSRSGGPPGASITRQDLAKFGVIPEFLGRLPVIVELDSLTVDELARIVTEPTNSVSRQYAALFAADDSTLTVTPGGARALAKKAVDAGSGARGLRALFEALLLDAMFHLPERPGDYLLDEEAVARGRVQAPAGKKAAE